MSFSAQGRLTYGAFDPKHDVGISESLETSKDIPRISIRACVRPSVRQLVRPSVSGLVMLWLKMQEKASSVQFYHCLSLDKDASLAAGPCFLKNARRDIRPFDNSRVDTD